MRVRPRRCRAVTEEGARERRHCARRLLPGGPHPDSAAPRGLRRVSGDGRGRAPCRNRPGGAWSPVARRPVLGTGSERAGVGRRRLIAEVGGGGLVVPPGVERKRGYDGRHAVAGGGAGRRRDRRGASAFREQGTWHGCSSVRRPPMARRPRTPRRVGRCGSSGPAGWNGVCAGAFSGGGGERAPDRHPPPAGFGGWRPSGATRTARCAARTRSRSPPAPRTCGT